MKPTEPSLQKMQTTPESNVQKMHIPQEWVEAACLAYHETFVGEPAPSKRAAKINAIPMKAALAAVIPLIREDERERLFSLANSKIEPGDSATEIYVTIADWLRAQGRE